MQSPMGAMPKTTKAVSPFKAKDADERDLKRPAKRGSKRAMPRSYARRGR